MKAERGRGGYLFRGSHQSWCTSSITPPDPCARVSQGQKERTSLGRSLFGAVQGRVPGCTNDWGVFGLCGALKRHPPRLPTLPHLSPIFKELKRQSSPYSVDSTSYLCYQPLHGRCIAAPSPFGPCSFGRREHNLHQSHLSPSFKRLALEDYSGLDRALDALDPRHLRLLQRWDAVASLGCMKKTDRGG